MYRLSCFDNQYALILSENQCQECIWIAFNWLYVRFGEEERTGQFSGNSLNHFKGMIGGKCFEWGRFRLVHNAHVHVILSQAKKWSGILFKNLITNKFVVITFLNS